MSITLPNIRKLFIPDPGYTIFDADLSGADAQVVAWEVNDNDLKQAFRLGLDIHSHNAEALWGSRFTSLSADSPGRKKLRQQCKQGELGAGWQGKSGSTAVQQFWRNH